MKRTDYFGFFGSHVGLKKSVTLIPMIKCFFRHVTSLLSGRHCFIRTAAAGMLVDLTVHNLQSKPAAVAFLHPGVSKGGLQSFQLSALSSVVLAARRLFQFHHVYEYIMTPEEHAVKIREAADLILRLLAAQKYADIIVCLDLIKEHTYDIQTNK